MRNIDKEIIAKKTNEKIGYYNYLEEERKISKQNSKMLSIVYGLFIFCICTVTVNALTNNSILKLGKNIIKVNGKDAEAEIYEKTPEVIYSKVKGDYVVTDALKCVTNNDATTENIGGSTICYPLETEFESIEIFYDNNSHYCGFHITGISNEGYFDDYLNDCN